MTEMSKQEIFSEMEKARWIIHTTQSEQLRRDQIKHLRKLRKMLDEKCKEGDFIGGKTEKRV